MIERALVICPTDPMETILIGPALRAFRQACPSAIIHLLATGRTKHVAGMLPFADGVLTRPEGPLAGAGAIEEGRYDCALVFTSRDQSPYQDAYGCYLAGIPVRAGSSSEFGGGVLSHWVKPIPETDSIGRYLAVVLSLGFAGAGRHLELRVPPRLQVSVDRTMAFHGIRNDDPMISVFCQADLGYSIAAAFSGTVQTPPAIGSQGRSPCFLVPLESSVFTTILVRGKEPIKGAITARSALTITDDPVTAYLSEGLDRPVLFIDGSQRVEDDNPRPTPYIPAYGNGRVCRDRPAGAIVRQALDMLGRADIKKH